MKNISGQFVAKDSLEHYDEMTKKIIAYAISLGIDHVYVNVVMENPDAVEEKKKYVMIGAHSTKHSSEKFLSSVMEHIQKDLVLNREGN